MGEYLGMKINSLKIKKFFNVFKNNNTEIYINQKRGILGFSYDEDQVLLMANKDEVFEKINSLVISTSSLDKTVNRGVST